MLLKMEAIRFLCETREKNQNGSKASCESGIFFCHSEISLSLKSSHDTSWYDREMPHCFLMEIFPAELLPHFAVVCPLVPVGSVRRAAHSGFVLYKRLLWSTAIHSSSTVLWKRMSNINVEARHKWKLSIILIFQYLSWLSEELWKFSKRLLHNSYSEFEQLCCYKAFLHGCRVTNTRKTSLMTSVSVSHQNRDDIGDKLWLYDTYLRGREKSAWSAYKKVNVRVSRLPKHSQGIRIEFSTKKTGFL